jgi:hypothetical protein
MVSYLKSSSGGKTQNMIVGPAGDEYYDGIPLYFADSDDPQYRIHCTVYSCPEIEGTLMRCPLGAKPTPGPYDRHLACVQPDGEEICMWEAEIPSGVSGSTLNVSGGGKHRIDGDATGNNCTAGLSGIAGEISSVQLINGTINHALALTIQRTKATSVYPVRDDDGGGHLAATDPASPVPNGQWFKLNITDAEIALEPAWRQPIYRAMRDYGMFVIDTGVGFGWNKANEMTYSFDGKTNDPAFDWLAGQRDVDSYLGRRIARTPSFPFDKLVALNPPPRP